MVIYVNHMVGAFCRCFTALFCAIAAELQLQFNSYLASDSNAFQCVIYSFRSSPLRVALEALTAREIQIKNE